MSDQNKRQLILETAREILSENGLSKLTQPQIASRLGIRQSHLTYYFPKRRDLIIALLDDFNDRAGKPSTQNNFKGNDSEKLLHAYKLITDPRRMRFFLSLILEAQDDPELKTIINNHIQKFNSLVVEQLDKKYEAEKVISILDLFRGLGIQSLLDNKKQPTKEILKTINRLLEA